MDYDHVCVLCRINLCFGVSVYECIWIWNWIDCRKWVRCDIVIWFEVMWCVVLCGSGGNRRCFLSNHWNPRSFVMWLNANLRCNHCCVRTTRWKMDNLVVSKKLRWIHLQYAPTSWESSQYCGEFEILGVFDKFNNTAPSVFWGWWWWWLVCCNVCM